MSFQFVITEDAECDVEDMVSYIAKHYSPRNAEQVLNQILEIANSLTTTPARGTHPPELRALGDRDFRQMFFKPYRLIYRVIGKQVVIYLIADGKRDMQSLLARRLLGA